MEEWSELSYPNLCYAFFQHFATDLPEEDLYEAIRMAYCGFSHPETAPLVRLNEHWQVLELFHGPTLAFKDFALQLLGNLYELQIKRSGRDLCILGATSGDTGAAAISGLLGKKGVKVFILYPDGKVSPLQERQMTCTVQIMCFLSRLKVPLMMHSERSKNYLETFPFVTPLVCQRLIRLT